MIVETQSLFYNTSGERISLSDEIARGGEGRILDVHDHPDLVAKIYHQPIGPEKATKLSVMVGLKTERLLNLTAWPVDTLHEFAGGPVSGFLMPRISDHKDIHVLYGVRSRNNEYPEAHWPFLIQAAANVARAFNVIHEHGHVIGDVNHASMVVSKRATVRLVDCDSFQITELGHQFLCEVGISTHLPPELQGKDLRGIVRTVDHDAFGLAIIIFQLLFMGRHPFSGTSLSPGDISLETAIKEYRFAYGPGAESRLMRQPPATLGLESVSPQIASMFEQAFLSDANRPGAESWVEALTEMSNDLQKCSNDSAHYFISSLQVCPWCEIESHSGIVLFHGGTADIATGPFDIVKTWMEILSIPAPSNDTLLKKSSELTTSTVTRGSALVQRHRIYSFVAAGFVLISFFGLLALDLRLWISVPLFGAILYLALQAMKKMTAKIRSELADLENQTHEQLSEARKLQKGKAGSNTFSTALRELTTKRTEYEKLSQLRFRKLDELRKTLRDHQLHDFLSSHRIEDCDLPEIGPADIIALESCGIENADSVSLLLSSYEVPGLKPSQRSALEEWRSWLQDVFRDHPKWNLSPGDLASVEAEIASAKVKLQKELRTGAAHLKYISQQMRYSHRAGHPSLKDCLAAYFQAHTYLEQCSPISSARMAWAFYWFSVIVFFVRSLFR